MPNKTQTIVEEYQTLRFETSKTIAPQRLMDLPADFYETGYTVVSGLSAINEVQAFLDKFVASIDPVRAPLFKNLHERLQLAKVDAIPVCEDIVQTGFQALHYDMGMPFLPAEEQPIYPISALYRPADSEPNPLAKTRIVSLSKLLAQKSFGRLAEIEERLVSYVRAHGDGWVKPQTHNTLRLAIFARVLDAVTGGNKLAAKIDTMIGQCFEYDRDLKGEYGLRQEQIFFQSAGLDLTKAEEQIALAPGDMLIFDNIRCVHGRVGQRRKRELIHFLYGVKQATDLEIQACRTWLTGQFA